MTVKELLESLHKMGENYGEDTEVKLVSVEGDTHIGTFTPLKVEYWEWEAVGPGKVVLPFELNEIQPVYPE
jgi:hypothetical protein